MKFLSVRDLKSKSAQVWKELPDQKDMVITSNGRPVAILASVNENSLDEILSAFRQQSRQMVKILSPSEFLDFLR